MNELFNKARQLWLSPGEEFITEGQPAENFYVLLKGQVRITKKLHDNKETNIASNGSGNFKAKHQYRGHTIRGDYTHIRTKPPIKNKKGDILADNIYMPINITGNLADYGTTIHKV